jgi:hypothetical protein
MKHTLKAPGSKRLKVGYEKLLTNFGFNLNLRHCTEAYFGDVTFAEAGGHPNP